MLVVPHPITKQIILFCLLVHRGLGPSEHSLSQRKRWAFSLTIPHGMHLVVPTHTSLFWVVCHLSRTFPLKEFEREPQNRLSLLPTARPYPHLLLTHDPLLLSWLGTSWWCLSFARAPFSCMSKACLLLMHLPWSKGSSVHSAAHP